MHKRLKLKLEQLQQNQLVLENVIIIIIKLKKSIVKTFYLDNSQTTRNNKKQPKSSQ